jgi:hypothetical protein
MAPPRIDAPALKWLGAEFRKLIPVEPLPREFERLCAGLGDFDVKPGDFFAEARAR